MIFYLNLSLLLELLKCQKFLLLIKFVKISESLKSAKQISEKPEIAFGNFSVHAQEPPDAVNDSHIPPSCGWWFLTSD